MDLAHVASAVLYMANLPLDTNVQFMTIMATEVPFLGRGRTLDAGRRSRIIRSTSIPFRSEGVVNSKNMPIGANVGRAAVSRDGVESDYKDVFTPEAVAALEALTALDADRQSVHGRQDRRAGRFVHANSSRIAFLDPAALIPRTPSPSSRRATASSTAATSPRPAAAVDPGHRPRRQAARDRGGGHPQRRLRAAVRRRRLDVRRRGRARPGVDDVAGQPAQPQARHRPAIRSSWRSPRQVAARDEHLGRGLLRPADRRRLAPAARLHHQDLPRRAACTWTTGTSGTRDGAGFSASIVDAVLYVVNNHQQLCAGGRVARPVPAQDPDRRRGRALERHARRARSSTWACPPGTIKVYVLVEQLEAVLPADGDPRRARPRTSSASTPAAGTTSTASPTRWPGTRRSSIPTSTPSP